MNTETTSAEPQFQDFPKIARLSRECCVTEKIDGTNAQILITEDGRVIPGSRSRFITPEDDNYGFARWVKDHEEELRQLGVGRHFGEWWGSGIQRGYGLPKGEKRWSLFNVARWHRVGEKPYISQPADLRLPPRMSAEAPACCHVVPVLWRGTFCTNAAEMTLESLKIDGSYAAPGFMKPEGIVIWHDAAQQLFKKTIERDEEWKGKPKA